MIPLQPAKLPFPFTGGWGGPPAVQLAFGGLRKTTNQNIGALGAAFVAITNYQAPIFANEFGIATDAANGTLTFARPGNYVLTANIDATFTQDNNTSRSTILRLFNVTDNIAIADASARLYAGGYTAGFQSSNAIAVNINAVVGKALRLEIGGGSTFAAFNIAQAAFSAQSVGPV